MLCRVLFLLYLLDAVQVFDDFLIVGFCRILNLIIAQVFRKRNTFHFFLLFFVYFCLFLTFGSFSRLFHSVHISKKILRQNASGSKGLFYNDLTERRTLHTEAPSGRELAP